MALHIASYKNLWLKALKIYSVAKVNVIPSGGYAIEIVCALTYAIISDAIGKRWPVIMVGAFLGLLGGTLLGYSIRIEICCLVSNFCSRWRRSTPLCLGK
jgi:ACS family pantothenate transporter-like MFS transporter